MGQDEHHLTPEQERTIGRVQLGGVLLLIAMMIGIRIADRTLDLATWKLLGVFFVALGALLVVCTVIVARVEQLTTRELATRTIRDSGTDLEARLARIRHR